MEINRTDAVRVFQALGYTQAERWTREKLASYLGTLHTRVSGKVETGSDRLDAVLDTAVEASRQDQEFTVLDDTLPVFDVEMNQPPEVEPTEAIDRDDDPVPVEVVEDEPDDPPPPPEPPKAKADISQVDRTPKDIKTDPRTGIRIENDRPKWLRSCGDNKAAMIRAAHENFPQWSATRIRKELESYGIQVGVTYVYKILSPVRGGRSQSGKSRGAEAFSDMNLKTAEDRRVVRTLVDIMEAVKDIDGLMLRLRDAVQEQINDYHRRLEAVPLEGMESDDDWWASDDVEETGNDPDTGESEGLGELPR